jgi:hypothetical protein
MVRSLWLRSLAASLVWTGVVWAQQPVAKTDNAKTEQILTIQEAGKSPQKCKVVQTWRTSDGHQAYQVRALDTGEMMTITEKAATAGAYGAKPQGIAMQIYHWGSMHISPPNVPAPASDKPATISTYAVKSSPMPTGSEVSSYAVQTAPPRAAMAASPYSVPNSPQSSATAAAAKPISTPAPEKDWRQSWAKADDKPLKIEDKSVSKDSIANAPQLKIEGKPGARNYGIELPPAKDSIESLPKDPEKTVKKPDIKAVVKLPEMEPKAVLSADDPLLHPDKYMPKSLDVTPRKKAGDQSAIPSPGAKQSGPISTDKSPGETGSVRMPTLADIAGGPKVESKPTAETKPALAAKPGRMASFEALPPIPESIPAPKAPIKLPASDETKSLADSNKPFLLPTIPTLPDSNKPFLLPTIPTLPDSAPPTIPYAPHPSGDMPLTVIDSNNVGQATASSHPVVPVMPIPAPALPPAPIAAVVPSSSSSLPPMQAPARSERPNFIVLEAGRLEGADPSIRLPGVPNAVVAFGQPVTVTAPPPDMIRKKSLEGRSIQIMVGQLKDSLYPSQREWAAAGLTSANWKAHPEIVDALCIAALDDPAPGVRARCAHSLAAIDVRTERVLETIHKLQADKEESVRSEAEEALKLLQPADLPQE